ncbi:MAG TPA: nitrilase-related carbon-nitrogen hydrolase, partial [Propionicimonas sp.]
MRVALVQLTSGHDVEANLAKIVATASSAAAQGAELLVYPEATMFAFGASLTDIAQPIDGAFGTAVHGLAEELGVTIV